MDRYIHTRLLILFLLLAAPVLATAQDDDDLLGMLEEEQKPAPQVVIATFKDSRIVNFHTIETAGKRTLDFRIAHRFGPFSGGPYEFFGLDGGASIRLALEYSYDGRFQVGLGRTNVDKTVDGYAKYRLLRQKDEGMPLSVTLLSGMCVNTLRGRDIGGYNEFEFFTSRLSYVHQVMIARKFSESLSLQLSPTMIHLNMVPGVNDKNDIFALIGLGRMKFTRRMAITAEYALRLTQDYRSGPTGNDPYYNSFAVGLEVETGGHVFQVHLANSRPMLETQAIPFTQSSWGKGEIRLGFNISRVFRL